MACCRFGCCAKEAVLLDRFQAATSPPEMTEADMAQTKSFEELVQRRGERRRIREKPAARGDRDAGWRCRDGQGDPARLHQRDGRLRKARRGERHAPQSLIRMFGSRGNP